MALKPLPASSMWPLTINSRLITPKSSFVDHRAIPCYTREPTTQTPTKTLPATWSSHKMPPQVVRGINVATVYSQILGAELNSFYFWWPNIPWKKKWCHLMNLQRHAQSNLNSASQSLEKWRGALSDGKFKSSGTLDTLQKFITPQKFNIDTKNGHI